MTERTPKQDGFGETGGLSGWGDLDATMRGVDESKIRDYKEDMDALLVFAGLYSAVLTAFLIESYQNLQQDPQQVMIDLLRQISLQTANYSLAASNRNMTAPPSSDNYLFVPQPSAVLVNVCWFASLVLSLASASFSILVKQWLREYLAMDHIAPQEHLRIRHFRNLGLEDWKLFEIAAILPLILQLSLALFSTGLCLFTWSIHQSIGTTTVCLVTGWATFFIFALLAPVISPRCPYKTTFLKAPLGTIRIYILSVASYIARHRTLLRSQEVLSKLWVHVTHTLDASLAKTVRVARRTVHAAKQLSASLGIRRDIPEIQPGVFIIDFKEHESSHRLSFGTIKEEILMREERQICLNHANDPEVFSAVDAMLLNDDLLLKMQMALHHTPPPFKAVFQFALDVIGRRLNCNDLRDHAFSWDGTFDHGSLSCIARNTVLNTVTDGIIATWDQSGYAQLFNVAELPVIISACQLLLSYSGPVIHQVRSLVQRTLDSALLGCFMGIRYQTCRNSGYVRGLASVLSNIRDVLLALDAKHARDPFKVFLQCYFWDDGPEDADYISCSLLAERLRWDDLNSDDVSCQCLVALMELCLTAIAAADDQRRGTHQNLKLPLCELELLNAVLDIIPSILENHPDHDFRASSLAGAMAPRDVFRSLFDTPEILPSFLDSILARSNNLAIGQYGAPLLDSLIAPEFSHWEEYIHVQRDRNPELSLVSTLHLSYMIFWPQNWWNLDIPRWRKTCEDLMFLAKKSGALTRSNHAEQRGEVRHSNNHIESKIARAILQHFDHSYSDNIHQYRHRDNGASQSDTSHAQTSGKTVLVRPTRDCFVSHQAPCTAQTRA